MRADAPEDSRALLVVSRNSSRCSACGKPALAARSHRLTGRSDIEGCGVEFLGVTGTYAGRRFREATEKRIADRVGLPYVHSVPEYGGEIVLVCNYDASIRFYSDVLGLRVAEDLTIEPGAKRWVLLDEPDRPMSLLLLEPRLAPDSYFKIPIRFYTDDIWRTVAECKRKGVVLTREPRATELGMEAEFEDLDSNQIEIFQSWKAE